jgi:hypothetical protein
LTNAVRIVSADADEINKAAKKIVSRRITTEIERHLIPPRNSKVIRCPKSLSKPNENQNDTYRPS